MASIKTDGIWIRSNFTGGLPERDGEKNLVREGWKALDRRTHLPERKIKLSVVWSTQEKEKMFIHQTAIRGKSSFQLD